MNILKDKIETIVQGLGLTPMRFADIIDIKRPIISHILTGRNKPSLDVIMKIVERFPELGYDWINDQNDLDYKVIREIRDTNNFDMPSYNMNGSGNGAENLQISNSQADQNVEKTIEKIVFFYSDGSFKEFNP